LSAAYISLWATTDPIESLIHPVTNPAEATPAGFLYLIIAGAGKDYTAASWKPSAQAFKEAKVRGVAADWRQRHMTALPARVVST
jgi:hypothetical protein